MGLVGGGVLNPVENGVGFLDYPRITPFLIYTIVSFFKTFSLFLCMYIKNT